jgi:hypothetical protein
MSIPRSVAELPLWETVMTKAGRTCQCTGQCGKTHAKTTGRCDRQHGAYAAVRGGHIVLLAAPADPTQLALAPHRAALLPATALMAWCAGCHNQARTRAAKTATSTPGDDAPALF